MDSFVSSMKQLLDAGFPRDHIVFQYEKEIAILGGLDQTEEVTARISLLKKELSAIMEEATSAD